MRLGFQRPLEHDDLWDVARRDEAAAVSARFQGALAATADPDKYPQVSRGRGARAGERGSGGAMSGERWARAGERGRGSGGAGERERGTGEGQRGQLERERDGRYLQVRADGVAGDEGGRVGVGGGRWGREGGAGDTAHRSAGAGARMVGLGCGGRCRDCYA